MSKRSYIDWYELTEIEQKMSTKIIHEAIECVDCKNHYIEIVENNTVYQCEMTCDGSKNVILSETDSQDSNEIEQPIRWWIVEQYVNEYLNGL